MGDDGQRGHDAQFRVGQEGRRDQDAVGEVVHAVAEQDHPARFAGLARVMAVGVVVPVALVMVRMAQQRHFFQ